MEKEFLKSRLETEQERCLERLAELTPGSEEYDRCWNNLAYMINLATYELRDRDDSDVPEPEPAPVPTRADSEPAPAVTEPSPAPTTGEPAVQPSEVSPSGDREPALKMEDVRAALAEARMKGVDVSKLIADMGAAKLSSVDPADYPKLMDALAKELEGK